MSRYTADRVSQDINNRPVYMGPMIFRPDGAAAHTDGGRGLDAIRLLATADPEAEMRSALSRRTELTSAYGFGVPSAIVEKPFLFIEGAAFIPIHGMLINRFPYSWGWATGYNFIRDQASAAAADADVKLIVYDVNTNGGTVAGCQETADLMFSLRGQKPSIAVVDSNCLSAGYYLASQADKVVMTPSGGVGSIGTMCMRLDLSGMFEQAGIKISLVHAGKYKADGYPYEPMSAEEEARIQASVDFAYDQFVVAVSRGRGISEEAVRATEAGSFNATEALQLKLVDAIVAPAAAVRDALCPPETDQGDDPNEEDDEIMTKPDATADTVPSAEAIAKAVGDAQTAERARITGILGCEEAKARPKLAAFLATSTSNSLADAQVLLAVSAVEIDPKTTGNPLEEAMNRNGGAGVGAGGGGGGDGAEGEDKVAAILAAQTAVTGRKSLTA